MNDGPVAKPGLVRRARPWLGTIVHIEAAADSAAQADIAVANAFQAIADVDRDMSFFRPDSDLARLHQHASRQPQTVSAATWTVLQHATLLAEASAGLFDPTIAGALVRQGLRQAPAGAIVGMTADPAADWRDIELLDQRQVRFRRPLWLDLGGIAKGYAVDCAINALRQAGAHSGSVNAGGDLRHFGASALPLQLRHPADPGQLLPLGQLKDAAAATSAGYFSDTARIDGKAGPQCRIMSPLIAPPSGLCQQSSDSVTVIAGQCWLADGLTKIVALAGQAAGPLLERFAASAAIVSQTGDISASANFWSQLGHLTPPGTPHAA